MNNYESVYQNNKSGGNSGVNREGLSQLKTDDFYSDRIVGKDSFQYILDMHKSNLLLSFTKAGENMAELHFGGHIIWVDANSNGRYQILDQDHAAEAKLIPTEFVRSKYAHVKYYFSIWEDVKNKAQVSKPGAEEQKLNDLVSELDLHLIRLVKLLIHDMANIEHIAEITDSKLSLTIRNNSDNNDKFVPNLIKDDADKWVHLKFNTNSYYVDEVGGLQNNDNDNILYYMAYHKTLKHLILMRATSKEFKIKSNVVHHLYISEDDGLGRYKAQTNEGAVSKQFFVPAGYVKGCHNILMESFNDYKKLQEESDVYSQQTRWCMLQDDAIHLINNILSELKSDLNQEIDKSLDHPVMSLASSIRKPNNFDEFYNRVLEREKRMRLERKGKSYPISLVIFNRRHKTTFIIHINYSANDIFYLDEKVRILISKYDPDYYVVVSEAWMPKNLEIQQRMSLNYRHGNITKLPGHEKTEILTFIGKTKNSINRGPDKSEVYEIVREKQNDENSRIVELKGLNNGGLDFGMEYHDWV